MGKILTADNTYEFKVTGIMQEIPHNSHIAFDFLASFETLQGPANADGAFIYGADKSNMQIYGLNPDIYTYLLLEENYSPAEFEKSLPEFLDRYFGAQLRQVGVVLKPYLQPLPTIHLHSHLDAELAALLVPVILPLFNALSGKALTLHTGDLRLLPAVFGIALFVGIVAGSYPAFFLSAFKPLSVLRGSLKVGSAIGKRMEMGNFKRVG